MIFEKYIIRNKDLIWRIIDDKAFLISDDGSKVHSLNKVGSLIWKSAEGQLTLDQIVELICNRFDVSEEEAKEDTSQFVEELLDKGLAKLSDTPLKDE